MPRPVSRKPQATAVAARAARTFRLTIAYDGTAYGGWQSQPNATTIQDLLENALRTIAGCPVTLHGSGRTDAGVHARAQVASCRLVTALSAARLRRALNANLPADIRVLRVQRAADGFHARFWATRKEYRYQIDCGPVADPFLRHYAWHHPQRLDLTAMRRAARRLKGRHDFSAVAAKSDRQPVRTIHKLSLWRDGQRLVIAVAADGFLYKMVRSLAGVLVKVGEGKLTPAQVGALLAGRRRTPVVETAPAHGLFLWQVWYATKAVDKAHQGPE